MINRRSFLPSLLGLVPATVKSVEPKKPEEAFIDAGVICPKCGQNAFGTFTDRANGLVRVNCLGFFLPGAGPIRYSHEQEPFERTIQLPKITFVD